MVGIPSGGKSTYIHTTFRKDCVVINTDNFFCTQEDQKYLYTTLGEILQESSVCGFPDIVLDGCNQKRENRRVLIQLLRLYGYWIECHYLETTFRAANFVRGERTATISLPYFIRTFESIELSEGFDFIKHIPFCYDPCISYVNQALFFDLDGTVRYSRGAKDWPIYPSDVVIYQDVHRVLRDYHRRGYLLIGVTNQGSIARGQSEVSVQDCILTTIKQLEVPIHDVFYCPHQSSDGCGCRKPNPQMAFWARNKYRINLMNSIMVGDKQTDEEFSNNAGIGSFHYRDDFFR